jgi:hypothetical protein
MSNIIYHDFTPKPSTNIIQLTLDSGEVYDITEFESDQGSTLDDILDINYIVQPCLFGWEAVIFNSLRYGAYSLPNFYSSKIAAETEAEAHRLEELTKFDSIFDDLLEWDDE